MATINPSSAPVEEYADREQRVAVWTSEVRLNCNRLIPGITSTTSIDQATSRGRVCEGTMQHDGYTRLAGAQEEITEYRHKCSECGSGEFTRRPYPLYQYEPLNVDHMKQFMAALTARADQRASTGAEAGAGAETGTGAEVEEEN